MKNFKMLSRAEMRNVAGGNMCGDGQFACGDGTCIDQILMMNGVANCSDGSDEKGCFNESYKCAASADSAMTGVCAPEKSCKCFVTKGGFGYYETSDCTY